jgi:glycosyltransferase involved in cell wall biosynthesis
LEFWCKLKRPLFTVVIPTFNRVALLQRAIDSVLRQSFGDFELVVVDDGSTDATLAYLKELGSSVRTFQQQNAGPGVARNLGVEHARGKYICFLDDDDAWFPWTLEQLVRAITTYEYPSMVGGKLFPFTNDDEIHLVQKAGFETEAYDDYFQSSTKGYFVGAGMLTVERSLFLSVGGYSSKRMNCEDHDLVLRMGDAPKFVQMLSPFTVAQRKHENSVSMDLNRNFEGARHLLECEERGGYPGGKPRRLQREEIILRHVRSIALESLANRQFGMAISLYRRTFLAHMRFFRWRFLIGFWLRALKTIR